MKNNLSSNFRRLYLCIVGSAWILGPGSILGAGANRKSDVCQWKPVKGADFELKYKHKKVTVSALEKDAKVESCRIWKEFPQFLLAEISLGAAGTSQKINKTELYIFDLKSGSALKQVFRTTIRENLQTLVAGEVETETLEQKVELKNLDGKPAIVHGTPPTTSFLKK